MHLHIVLFVTVAHNIDGVNIFPGFLVLRESIPEEINTVLQALHLTLLNRSIPNTVKGSRSQWYEVSEVLEGGKLLGTTYRQMCLKRGSVDGSV
jgi:hypothetical protein